MHGLSNYMATRFGCQITCSLSLGLLLVFTILYTFNFKVDEHLNFCSGFGQFLEFIIIIDVHCS